MITSTSPSSGPSSGPSSRQQSQLREASGKPFETENRIVELYDRTRQWVSGNYGKTLGAVAALAAVGVIGYVLGRNRSPDEQQPR
ncbi:MAG: hypothetical protein AABZ06_12710 [Bdellovibrionota bacterium]